MLLYEGSDVSNSEDFFVRRIGMSVQLWEEDSSVDRVVHWQCRPSRSLIGIQPKRRLSGKRIRRPCFDSGLGMTYNTLKQRNSQKGTKKDELQVS